MAATIKKGTKVLTPLGHAGTVEALTKPKGLRAQFALVRYDDGPLAGRQARFERRQLATTAPAPTEGQ